MRTHESVVTPHAQHLGGVDDRGCDVAAGDGGLDGIGGARRLRIAGGVVVQSCACAGGVSLTTHDGEGWSSSGESGVASPPASASHRGYPQP